MSGAPRWSGGLGVALVLLLVLGCVPATPVPAAAPATGEGSPPSAAVVNGQPPGAVTPPGGPARQALVEEARREGALSLVWGDGALGSNEDVSRLARAFNEHYGLNL